MTKRLRPYALDLAHNGPRLLWLLLIFLAFALPWPAHGADGVYLGLQGGISLGRMDGASRPQTISPEWVHPTRSDTAGSARLSVGYRRGLWAVEVGTGTLHRYSENRDWQTACGGRYCQYDDFQDIVQTSIEADARVKRYVPLSEHWSAYGLLGASLVRWRRELDNCVPSCQNVQTEEGTTTKAHLGLGVQYDLSQRWSLTAEYVYTPSVLGITTHQLLAGAMLHF